MVASTRTASKPALRWRTLRRSEVSALRPARRSVREPVRVAQLTSTGVDPAPAGVCAVAFVTPRKSFNAVRANRARRRLRAALDSARNDGTLPSGAYLVIADPGVDDIGFAELGRRLGDAMRTASGVSSARSRKRRPNPG